MREGFLFFFGLNEDAEGGQKNKKCHSVVKKPPKIVFTPRENLLLIFLAAVLMTPSNPTQ